MKTESIYVYEYEPGSQKTYCFSTQAVKVKHGKHSLYIYGKSDSLYIYGKSDCYGEVLEFMAELNATTCARSNPRFNRAKFFSACNVQ